MSRRKKPFPFFLWHRRLGLVALIFVIILSITGIMLNHTEALKLDESIVESELLLDWYGISPPGEPVSFSSASTRISQWGEQLFFNEIAVFSHHESLTGIAVTDDVIAVALEENVLLLDHTGDVIELLPAGLNQPIVKAGSSQQRVLLLDESGQHYLSDSQLTRWQAIKQPEEADWSKASLLSEDELAPLKQSFRGQGLTLERVILDLHSGRLFHPTIGVIIMDASAVIMMLLGISGLWIWWSRKLKMRGKKHYRKRH